MKLRDLIIILAILYFLSRILHRGREDEKLATLRAEVRRNFSDFMAEIESMGFIPKIISSHRTYKQQAAHYKKDKRNAPPGHSTHEMDTGIDIIVYTQDGKVLQKSTPKSEWIKTGIPQLAVAKYGMRWGGEFKGYADNNHFDYLLKI